MGNCAGKKKTRPSNNDQSASATQSMERKPTAVLRRSLSFWTDNQAAVLSLLPPAPALSSRPSLSLYGLNCPNPQEQYDDKTPHISGTNLDSLAAAGIAVACKKGDKGLMNQDDYCVVFRRKMLVFGVFDGHGEYGHYVSDFVHFQLPAELINSPYIKQHPKKAMLSAFSSTQQALLTHCKQPDSLFNCQFSGSTGTLVLCRKKKLVVGHVGDSRAVLGRRLDTGEYAAIELTHDHKPNLERERARIHNKHGEVRQMPGDCDYRVFCKGKDYPGLAMSRAFGDLEAQEVGVIAEPEVREYQVQPNDEFLLICSDGIWEFLTNEKAVNTVANCGREQGQKAVETLCRVAYNQWARRCEDMIDDITALVVFLPKPGCSSYVSFTGEWSSDSELSLDSRT